MNIKISNAQFDDIEDILSLCTDMHSESMYSFLTLDASKLEHYLRRNIDCESSLFLIAHCDETLAGVFMASVQSYFFSKEKLTQDLIFYILPKFRGSRASIRMIRRYIEWSKSIGAREACLSTTTGIASDRVCFFFEKMGFRKVGYVTKLKL